MKYRKKEFHFWTLKCTLKTTNHTPKYLEKKIDRQSILNINSEHPKSLKNSISYSQALRIKRICSTKKDFDHHSKELQERFLKQGYDQKLVDEQLEKVDKLVRDNLLQVKDQGQQDPKRIPLILTYNQFLPSLTVVVHKNWNILQTNKNQQKLLQEHPITAFKSNKNLKEVIGGMRIENGKVKEFNNSSITGKSTPFLSGVRTLCCNQVLTTNTFMSQQSKRTFNIFFNLNCKSEYLSNGMHIMQDAICRKSRDSI